MNNPPTELTETQMAYNVASSDMFQLAAYGHHRYHPSGEALTDEGKRQQRDYNDRLLAARSELESAVLRLVAEHAETFRGDWGVVANWLRSVAGDPEYLSLMAVRPDERDEILDGRAAPSAGLVAVPPTTALRDRIADAIRNAACPGNCGTTEEECARERIQPFVWHHGRLAGVEGSPEQFADVVLGVWPAGSEAHRLALSEALGLGTGASWDAIRDRAAELQSEVASLTEASRRLLEQRQEMAEERYAWQERGDRAEARVRTLEAGLPAGSEGTAATRAAALTEAERTMLTYALNQAQLRIWSVGGVTDEDQAALVSLRRLAAETQPDTEAAPLHAEDPARIDRLRPEFTDHASVESIDVQTRRAQRQRGLWDSRIRKLAELRATRQAQIEAGTWPSSAAFEADSASQTSPKADSKAECANCWREVENRSTPNMGGPPHDKWVHVPGGFTVCFPQRGADSPRAEPKPTAASAGVPTDEEANRIVAYVLAANTDLHCLRCTPSQRGDIWTPVTADELDDGGLCTFPDCGADVLIQQQTDEEA